MAEMTETGCMHEKNEKIKIFSYIYIYIYIYTVHFDTIKVLFTN